MSQIFNAFLQGQEASMQQGQGQLAMMEALRQRKREDELNRLLGGSVVPATPATTGNALVPQYGEMGESYAPQSQSVEIPGQPASFDFNRVLPALAQGGFGKELFAMKQAQDAQDIAKQNALVGNLLKSAEYQKNMAEAGKTTATTISPIELEKQKSLLRQQETMAMLKAMGINVPGTPAVPGTPPIPTPGGPMSKTINGKVYININGNWFEQ